MQVALRGPDQDTRRLDEQQPQVQDTWQLEEQLRLQVQDTWQLDEQLRLQVQDTWQLGEQLRLQVQDTWQLGEQLPLEQQLHLVELVKSPECPKTSSALDLKTLVEESAL